MSRLGVTAVILACPMAMVATPSEAQVPTRVISGEPVCTTCVITRHRIATITDRDYPPGALGNLAAAHVLSNGSFLVTAGPGFFDELYWADPSGRIITRIGNKGAGPGEYRSPSAVLESDSVYMVFDPARRRVTALSKQGFEVISTAQVPGEMLNFPAAFSDGRYILNGTTGDPDRAGHPLHIVSTEGRILRSFGRDARTVAEGARLGRTISVSGDTAIWVARSTEYRIERWDTTGTLRAVYERRVPWFQPIPDSLAGGSVRGQPRLRQIHEDNQGRLWTLIGIQRRPEQETPTLSLTWDKSDSEMIIEVLDPERLEVIASRHFGRGIWGAPALGAGFFDWNYRLSDDHLPRLDVFGYELRVSR